MLRPPLLSAAHDTNGPILNPGLGWPESMQVQFVKKQHRRRALDIPISNNGLN